MKIKTPDVNKELPKTNTITPEMCECGRLYKDRRDVDGKMICSACYLNTDVETLKKLWDRPVRGLGL